MGHFSLDRLGGVGGKRWVDTGEGLFRLIDDWTKANDKRPQRCEVKKGKGAKLKYQALKQTLVKSDTQKAGVNFDVKSILNYCQKWLKLPLTYNQQK